MNNECSLCVETATGAKMILIEYMGNKENRICLTDAENHPIMSYLVDTIEARQGCIILRLKKKRK